MPRSVLEIPGSQRRLDRLTDLIARCRYSFHDISRVELDRIRPQVPRFNMPFELGVAVGNSEHMGDGRSWYVFEARRFRALKSLSDLNGTEIYIHGHRGFPMPDQRLGEEPTQTHRARPAGDLSGRPYGGYRTPARSGDRFSLRYQAVSGLGFWSEPERPAANWFASEFELSKRGRAERDVGTELWQCIFFPRTDRDSNTVRGSQF